ncbi:MAG: hypothetical protein JWL76_1487 [Thermoleophilia bacterium]|nr:hypothetical protein [Thermoleophilia bacterium]
MERADALDGVTLTTSLRPATAPPPSLPVRRAATSPADIQAIETAMQQLRATSSGREIADFLVASRMEIRVLPDAEFARNYPGAGAVYDPKAKAISVPQGALHRSSFVTTLAHEGKHALDFSDRPHWAVQSFGLIGGSAADGAKALVTFRNPVTAWLDSLTARQSEDEVNAYHLQAQVASELGKNESSWSLGQARDGAPLPIDQVRSNVATNDLYRMDPTRRLVLGAGLGLGVTSFAAIGAQALASKLRPGSFLAGHAWPVYAIGGAMTAAWVVSDQIRARRLEAA